MTYTARLKLLVMSLLTFGVVFGTSGCSHSDKPMSESEKNLKALAVFYGQYVGQHRGQGPPNEAEFKKYVQSLPAAQLEVFKLDQGSLDQVFISPRDKEPYGVAYKTKSSTPGSSGGGMVIWEQKGVNGKHFVADSLGKIEEIDEATFNQRLSAVAPSK